MVPTGALFGGAPLWWGALSGLGRRPPPGAYPSGSAIGVLVVTWFGSGVVVSRPLPPLAAALVTHRPLTSIAMLAPLASLQTPSAPNPSQARGLLQTAPYASARSARRFHAARIGGWLAGVRSTICAPVSPLRVACGGLLCCSLAVCGRCAPQGYGLSVAACSPGRSKGRLGLQAAPAPLQPRYARLPRSRHHTPTLRRLNPAPRLAVGTSGGLRPPHPRSCGMCVPLLAGLRPRRYRLRNDAPALPRLVTHLPPFPHPLPPFPPRTPRGGTTIGKVRFCRLSR